MSKLRGAVITFLCGAFLLTIAPSAQGVVVQRQEFTCNRASHDTTCWPGNNQDSVRITKVPPGHYLCVAVRGSGGAGIIFHAWNVASGAWKGRESRPLRVGDARDCTWRNTYSTDVTVGWKARSTGATGGTVLATSYAQTTG